TSFLKKTGLKTFSRKSMKCFCTKVLKVQKTFCKKFSGGVWGNAPRQKRFFLQPKTAKAVFRRDIHLTISIL
ncbi:MAG: hypothetical protein FWB93_05435, partial [Oscillospiraceae bacterium]|nr:hypothetical protein [Oscillospiraceae bacterium]